MGSLEDHENQLAGVSRKHKIIQEVPENSALKQGFNEMPTSEREGV